MVTAALPTVGDAAVHCWPAVLSTRTAPLPADLALVAARIALAWIFIYYGAGKLFGCVQRTGPPPDGALLLEYRPPPSREGSSPSSAA